MASRNALGPMGTAASMGPMGTVDERIRVHARDGEEVTLSCNTARLAGTIKDLMDFATSENGIYAMPAIRASKLQLVCKLNDPEYTWPSMDQLYDHSLVQLIKLIEDALYLDAPMALKQIQRAIAFRLNGKRALEIRALLGEDSDFGSAEELAASLAESAFVPEESFEAPQQPASSMEPPALLKEPSFTGVPATADAQEAALGLVDVATLVEFKGMNRRWRALARRVLCSRLCRRDGQPVPTQLDKITDLDVEQLIEAGRPWEVFIAGRMLPGLARIHGYGFEVDVAKVRAAEVSMGVYAAMMFDQQAGQLMDQQAAVRDHQRITEAPLRLRAAEGYPQYGCHPAYQNNHEHRAHLAHLAHDRALAQAALKHSCMSGKGEPPLKLTTAAIACAGLRVLENSVTKLGLSRKGLGLEGAMLLSYLVASSVSLTSLDLSENALCNLWKSPFGGPANGFGGPADGWWGGRYVNNLHGTYSAEGITAIANAICVNRSLTCVDLSRNIFGPEGARSIAEAIRVNSSLTSLDLTCNQIGSEGASALGEALKVNSSLLRVDVRGNIIAGDGAAQLSAAVLGNLKIEMFNEIPIKEMRADSFKELNITGKGIGDEGIMVVAGLLPAMASLTSLRLRYNHLGPEGANALAPALAANSSLTSLDLDGNQLCGMNDNAQTGLHPSGTYIAKGIAAIADALRINGSLTKLSLASNMLGEDGTKSICEALQDSKTLKELNLSGRFPAYNNIGHAAGAKHVADMLGVNRSLTKLSLARNGLGEEGTKLLCDALEGNITLKELDLSGDYDEHDDNIGGAAGAKHVAKMLLVNRSLTECNLSWLDLEEEGEVSIRNAVHGKAGFECAAIHEGTVVYVAKVSPAPVRAVVQTYDAPSGMWRVQLQGSQWQKCTDYNGKALEGTLLVREDDLCMSCIRKLTYMDGKVPGEGRTDILNGNWFFVDCAR